MKILSKYTLANIKGNRARMPLIVLCIVVAVIMFGTSIILPKIIRNFADKETRSIYGNSDLYIADSIDNLNQITSMYYIPDDVVNSSEYIISVFALSGTIKANGFLETANIFGVSYEDVKKFNEPKIIDGDVNNLSSDGIIVSKHYADSVGVKVGSVCRFSYADKFFLLRVCAIADNAGLFEWSSMNNIIVSKDAIASMVSTYVPVNGMFNVCLIKLNDNSETNLKWAQGRLSEAYPDWNIYRTYDVDKYNDITTQTSGPMVVASSVVVVYCFFIILLTMFLVFDSRVKQFATMKCLGASKEFQYKSVVLESLFYGVVGGLLGTIIFLTTVQLLNIYLPDGYLFNNISFLYYIVTFIFGCVFSVISSIIPALKTQNLSIRQTMVKKPKTKKQVVIIQIIAMVLLIVATIASLIQPLGKLKILSIFVFATIICSLLILIPYILKYLITFFIKLFDFKSFSLIYTKNSFTNANLKVVSSIMFFSIFIVMFLSITVSTIEWLGKEQLYIDYYTVSVDNIYDGQGSVIKSVANQDENVKNIYEVTYFKNNVIYINEEKHFVNELRSFSVKDIASIYSGKLDSDEQDLIEKLSSNKNYILLNASYKYVFGVKEGDLVKFIISTVPEKTEVTLVVAGFIDYPEGNNSSAVMNINVLNSITNVNGYNSLYFKINENNANEFISNLQKSFGTKYSITKYFETRRLFDEAHRTPTLIFSIYVIVIIVMSILFSVVGIYLALRQNIKSHKTMNTIGMGSAKFIKINCLQLLYVSFVSLLISALCTLLLIKPMLNIILMFEFYVHIKVNWLNLIIYLLSTIFGIGSISLILSIIHSKQIKIHERQHEE